MCLGSHNKEECVNIACFRCNGSGHKNSNCSMKESGFPICPKCKKKSHSERDCSMLSLSFGRAAADVSEVVCHVCGERGHAAGFHLAPQPPPMSEESLRDGSEEQGAREETGDNGELLWQDDRVSEAEDSAPGLYEPKESFHRKNSDDILHTLEGDA